jgi:propanol-preferring alcohol dehydrogenase
MSAGARPAAAMVLTSPRPIATSPLELEQRRAVAPAAGELALAVSACAVCRTDLQLCEGDLVAKRLPMVPGHQVVGTVAAIGAGVDGWRVGDRAGVAWLAAACGTCRFCTSGRENLCLDASCTGWDRDGGFATWMTARADFCHHLAPTVTDAAIAPLLCGGAIGLRSLRIAEIGPDRPGRLGLYGFGASARCVIQIALHWGCDVFVVTRSADERRRALEMGALWAGDLSKSPPVALDAAITTAPAGQVVVRALEAVDRGGIVAINAIHLDGIPAFPYESLWWERSLRSVANVTRDDVRDVLALAADIPIVIEVDEHPLHDVNRALIDISRGTATATAVVRCGQEGPNAR